jgi:hypothetical protein
MSEVREMRLVIEDIASLVRHQMSHRRSKISVFPVLDQPPVMITVLLRPMSQDINN